jgi:hypothetical protein
MDSGFEFVAVDNPHANKLTIHILAAVAEHEREAISERTNAALAAAKARGKRLGTPLDPAGAVERMRVARKSRATQSAAINARKVATANGGQWRHVQVGQILDRRLPGRGAIAPMLMGAMHGWWPYRPAGAHCRARPKSRRPPSAGFTKSNRTGRAARFA